MGWSILALSCAVLEPAIAGSRHGPVGDVN